jgi:hypothetical protein
MSDQHSSIEPKVRVELDRDLIERFLAVEGPATHYAAEREMDLQLKAALFQQQCVCGHTQHWHGQEIGAAGGSGSCDSCECQRFSAAALSEEGQGEGHRVEIEFDGGYPRLRLIHPESGCSAPSQCGLCAADLNDPEAKRCYDCKDMKPEGCWLDGWFENLEADELLRGKVTVPIDAKWDCDHPIITITTPPPPAPVVGEAPDAVELLARELWRHRGHGKPWTSPDHPESQDLIRTEAKRILAELLPVLTQQGDNQGEGERHG